MQAYIGIDLGTKSVAAICFSDAKAALQPTFEFKALQEGYDSLLAWITSHKVTKPIFVFEPSGRLWIPPYSWLRERNYDAALVSSAGPKHFALARNKRTKNDRVDARSIAEFAAAETIEPQPDLLKNYEARKVARRITQLADDGARIKIRMKEEVTEVFPEFFQAFAGIDSQSSIAVLKKYPTPQEILKAGVTKLANIKVGQRRLGANRAERLLSAAKKNSGRMEAGSGFSLVLRSYISSLEVVRKETKDLCSWLDKNGQIEELGILKSFPGCNTKTAAVVSTELGDAARFATADKVVAYAGINPREISSGGGNQSHKSYRMSKQGNARLRCAIYQIALNAVRLDPTFQAYYKKKQAEGKKKKVALGHVMRKVLVTLWSMSRKKKAYEPGRMAVSAEDTALLRSNRSAV